MKLETLEALTEFVSATRNALCTSTEFGCENSELDESASALENELEKELIVAKAIKAITEADEDTLYGYLPEMLKRQSR